MAGEEREGEGGGGGAKGTRMWKMDGNAKNGKKAHAKSGKNITIFNLI